LEECIKDEGAKEMSRTMMFDTVLRGCTATYTVAPPNNGWYVDNTPWDRQGGNHIYTQDSIDIGGMTTTQEETFFPQAATIQNSPFYSAPGVLNPNEAPYGTLFEWVLITESPFDVSKWIEDQSYAVLGQSFDTQFTCPGIEPRRTTNQNQTIGFDNILYGRVQMIANNSSLPQQAGVVYATEEFGSMTPTASDRLYVTRIVKVQTYGIAAQAGFTIQVPHMRVIIVGSSKEENDLSYIMRLRQSYKLAQDLN
jgi:hypothetical protein